LSARKQLGQLPVARAAALALPNVAKAISGKTPRSVIVVTNRIVNVVV